MKVLVTATRCYRGYHSSEDSLRASDTGIAAVLDALREGGHEFEIRPVTPGECLDDYDVVMVTLTNALVQGNNDLYGALWSVAQDWTGGPPVVVNFDHWTLRDCVKSYVRLHVQPEKLFDGFIQYKHQKEGRGVEAILRQQLEMFAASAWPSTMTCAFNFGDRTLLRKGMEDIFPEFTFTYDPSYLHMALCERIRFEAPFSKRLGEAQRERKWVLGSISQHESWIKKQGLTWPVEYYGLPKKGWPFLSRDTLLTKYMDIWGALSPPYYHAGSGYWRARLVHYNWMGCITLADPREMPGKEFAPRAREIEQMSDTELKQLALDQHLSFCASLRDPEDEWDKIVSFFEGPDMLGRGRMLLGASRPEFNAPEPLQERLL